MTHYRLFYLFIAIIFGTCAAGIGPLGPAQAQSNVPNEDCNPRYLKDSLKFIQGGLDRKPTTPAEILTTLAVIAEKAGQVQANCLGLYWEGTGDKVVGPITLTSGAFRAILKTSGYGNGKFELLTGSCSSGDIMGMWFLTAPGQASEGSEALIKSSGCTALITLGHVTAPWTLEIEQLSTHTPGS